MNIKLTKDEAKIVKEMDDYISREIDQKEIGDAEDYYHFGRNYIQIDADGDLKDEIIQEIIFQCTDNYLTLTQDFSDESKMAIKSLASKLENLTSKKTFFDNEDLRKIKDIGEQESFDDKVLDLYNEKLIDQDSMNGIFDSKNLIEKTIKRL
jgi:hypothetical protein